MNDYENDDYSGGQSYASQDASAHYSAGGYTPGYGGYSSPSAPPPTPPESGRKERKKGVGAGAVIAICLVCSLLAAALGVGGTWYFLRGGFGGEDALSPTPAPAVTTAPAETTPQAGAAGSAAAAGSASDREEAQGEKIYELAKQQVVGVTTEITYTNYFGQVSAASVSGSGFIISDDGYIMTNNHVIEDARRGGYEVSVLTYDGTEYTAAIVGYDEVNDIAVLKVDATGLTPVTMGAVDDIVVGREVYPVGNPLGELNFSMSNGIISATDRTITTSADSAPINMFQIDASVNEGNSGGPVYDEQGHVIGVVTAKTSESGTEGLGFAIPIEDARHIAEQIIQYGYVKDRATIGVTGITVTDSMAERYNMVVGAYIRSVTEGSPADQAGLLERDIVTAIDGEPVEGYTEMTTMIRAHQVGETAEMTVWRNGSTLTLTVTFGESQPPVETTPEPQQSQQYQYGFGDMDDFFRQFFGGFGW